MVAYNNNISKTLVDPKEQPVFVYQYIHGKVLYQATGLDEENNEYRYKLLSSNLFQTLLLEFSLLVSDRPSFVHFSGHCFDHSSDHLSDYSCRNGPRSSYTHRCAYGSSPTAVGILSDHQNDVSTKVINSVKIDPQHAFTHDCVCCLAMNLKPEL